jgi:hypothetical protein
MTHAKWKHVVIVGNSPIHNLQTLTMAVLYQLKVGLMQMISSYTYCRGHCFYLLEAINLLFVDQLNQW